MSEKVSPLPPPLQGENGENGFFVAFGVGRIRSGSAFDVFSTALQLSVNDCARRLGWTVGYIFPLSRRSPNGEGGS